MNCIQDKDVIISCHNKLTIVPNIQPSRYLKFLNEKILCIRILVKPND